MVMFFSGQQCNKQRPEDILGKKARVMLSFYDNKDKIQKRFRSIYIARKKALRTK